MWYVCMSSRPLLFMIIDKDQPLVVPFVANGPLRVSKMPNGPSAKFLVENGAFFFVSFICLLFFSSLFFVWLNGVGKSHTTSLPPDSISLSNGRSAHHG